MTEIFRDIFGRADGGLGAEYNTNTGLLDSPTIVSNIVRDPNGGGVTAGATYITISLPADQYAEITVNNIASGSDYVGLFLRSSSDQLNQYRMFMSGPLGTNSCNLTFASIIAGGFSSLGTVSSFTFQAGDILRGVIIGTTISAYRNGVLLGTASDGNIATGQTGLLLGCNTTAADAGISVFSTGDLNVLNKLYSGTRYGNNFNRMGWNPQVW
jgi:hypothetical protein